uniref:RRM domain-containing protein n=1 Tax=Alexandrium monilatum TaxID=311494 RepID=A0A7S4S6I3_9DINO
MTHVLTAPGAASGPSRLMSLRERRAPWTGARRSEGHLIEEGEARGVRPQRAGPEGGRDGSADVEVLTQPLGASSSDEAREEEGGHQDPSVLWGGDQSAAEGRPAPPPAQVPTPFVRVTRSSAEGVAARRSLEFGDTTLLVRNIPSGYTQEQLLEEFDLVRYADLFFLPTKSAGSLNRGYGLINFRGDEDARAFQQRWHRGALQHTSRSRPLVLCRSQTQGFWPTLESITRWVRQRPGEEQTTPIIFGGFRRLDAVRYMDIAAASSVPPHEPEEHGPNSSPEPASSSAGTVG